MTWPSRFAALFPFRICLLGTNAWQRVGAVEVGGVDARAISTPKPTTVCATKPVTYTPHLYCGVEGTLLHPAPLQTAFPVSKQVQCRNSCLEKSGCISYGFAHGQCQLYRKPLKKQGYVIRPKKHQGTKTYFNRRCFTSSCSTTAPTSTSTPTSTPTPACSGAFLLKASNSQTTNDGQYALLANTGDNDAVTFAPLDAATPFTIDDTGQLIGFNGQIANIDAGVTEETLFFNTAAQIAALGTVPATCSIEAGVLMCTDQTATILFVCPDRLQLQIAETVPAGCNAVTLMAVCQRTRK